MPKVDPGYLNKNGKALILLESVIIVISMIMTMELTSYVFEKPFTSQELIFNTFYIVFSFMFAAQFFALALGLYSRECREDFLGISQRFLLSFLLAFLLVIVGLAVLENQKGYEPSLFMSAAVSCSIICFLRYQLLNFVVAHSFKKRILVLGAGKRASIIERRMRREVDRRQVEIVGFVRFDGDCEEELCRDKLLTLEGSVDQFAQKHNIEKIVVACDERRNNVPYEALSKCKLKGIDIVDILSFVEHETDQLAIDLIYPGWVIYSQAFQGPTRMNAFYHRVFNTILAFCILLFSWPFLILAIIGIKIEDGLLASVFYQQVRVGLNGQLFTIYKLRSMRENAEAGGAVWAKENDDRTTVVGRFIRKYRVDELPQLYNVIKGDMGFVGPRPERPEFVEQLAVKIPFYNERHHVKPGLTGWAQLRYPYGASETDALEKLKFDLYYVKNRSYLFDLLILLRTIEIVIFSKGSR
ncbi:TIGR03013 family XrtA/PEP-CTERM system glycosyltransferase [Psychrobium sp. 1_MG-2023]|uniref:TIGR03013 family XrtA/PEP-CTERM system glycosyltransferase n=1 Tax=Psychrobium sp. 1_MG-2023 TaxID=3062624 RepID=UPI000C341854|nr:TIGR03013 family XrtA/PEP-CTERM system glycosyltransferase [Psychrobium sp. 1_MG-2023]MDP2561124.1 TIGR03013 family PEP-CTERM/XrtA system glycosyltransferase [Psychrobium sp. 1_MG-2023]PKF55100.1 sugar transferase [Alteromonadales bacterium alter-6D02]